MELPVCRKCSRPNDIPQGVLVPLSDYGTEGASVTYKAWVCTNPQCDFALRIDKGAVSLGREANDNRRR